MKITTVITFLSVSCYVNTASTNETEVTLQQISIIYKKLFPTSFPDYYIYRIRRNINIEKENKQTKIIYPLNITDNSINNNKNSGKISKDYNDDTINELEEIMKISEQIAFRPLFR